MRKYENTQVMLLEDFGRKSLKILHSGCPFALPNFLHLAIQITDALGKVHQKNVIHQDINPSLRGWVNKFQFEKILDLTEPLIRES